MLLRSSSTPVIGSLLCSSSSSDSPNNFEPTKPHHQPPSDQNLNKVSFLHGGLGHPTNTAFHPFSCNSSPSSHSRAGPLGFRRVHSDGNLECLAAAAADDAEDFPHPHPPRPSRRPNSILQTIPSFSVHNSRDEEEEEEEGGGGGGGGEFNGLERSITIGDNITSIGGDSCFSNEKGWGGLVGIEESGGEGIVFDNGVEAPALFLARGLGIGVRDPSSALIGGGGGGGGGSDFSLVDSDGGGGDGSDLEGYYKKMVEENPSSALFLRNYAQFLYKAKGDFERAEEYYSRAILAEPNDGEVLLQYAKLIWEHHRDEERASSYFEQAVQAAPYDSHILAAHASFLWETEDDDDEGIEDNKKGSQDPMGVVIGNGGAVASASA